MRIDKSNGLCYGPTMNDHMDYVGFGSDVHMLFDLPLASRFYPLYEFLCLYGVKKTNSNI